MKKIFTKNFCISKLFIGILFLLNFFPDYARSKSILQNTDVGKTQKAFCDCYSHEYIIVFYRDNCKFPNEDIKGIVGEAAAYGKIRNDGIVLFSYSNFSKNAIENQKLSFNRALTVQRQLWQDGAPKDKNFINAFGDKDPMIPLGLNTPHHITGYVLIIVN